MASYTPNLNLLMKDPVADGADTFNIQTMLNENWEKIDAAVLRAMAAAAAYDAGKTYQQGDFCTQGGLLYRANQVIAQPEAWTAGHWTAISITDVIRGLTAKDVGAAPDGYGLGANNPRFPSGYDANQALTSGWWQASVNVPGNALCLLFVLARGDIVYQEALTDRDASGIESTCRLRRVLFRGTWTQWEWVNPPMILGTEYRTTERWNGSPVYCIAWPGGDFPSNTTKNVEVDTGTPGSVKAVFSYAVLGNGTMINGILGDTQDISGYLGMFLQNSSTDGKFLVQVGSKRTVEHTFTIFIKYTRG